MIRPRRMTWLLPTVAFLFANSIDALSAPANTLRELRRELGACIRAPEEGKGSELTIVLALKRDGSLLGQPRITSSHLLGDVPTQKAFVADSIAALAKCLPVSITDGLGGAIAGRLFAIQIGTADKGASI